MKKTVTFLLAVHLVCGACQAASAVEFQPFGVVEFAFNPAANMGGMENGGLYGFQDSADIMHNYGEVVHDKHYRTIQRFILGMDMVASENLSAHYDAVFGFFTWGGPAAGAAAPVMNGGALGSRAANIVTRQAYLDWTVPSTAIKVRMGQQMWRAPSFATGTLNPFDGNEYGSGLIISAPLTDNAGITAGWTRASSDSRRADGSSLDASTDDNFDIFSLTMPIHLKGLHITPWGAVGLLGKDSKSYGGTNYAARPAKPASGASQAEQDAYRAGLRSWEDGNGRVNNWLPLQGAAFAAAREQGISPSPTIRGNSTVYFAGVGGEATMLDPFRFAWDFAWSGARTQHNFTDRAGWLIGTKFSYATPYGVPTIQLWYGSGDDDNIYNGSERGVSSGGITVGSSAFFGKTMAGGPFILKMSGSQLPGTWGASVQWNKASFVDKLTQDFHITYIHGTNHTHMAAYAAPRYAQQYLTTRDSVLEFNVQSTYTIYDNLAVCLDTSYVVQNLDGKLWARGPNGELRARHGDSLHFSNAWNAALLLRYTF